MKKYEILKNCPGFCLHEITKYTHLQVRLQKMISLKCLIPYLINISSNVTNIKQTSKPNIVVLHYL